MYGVGILLYEALAGRTPFAGPGTDYTVAHRHVSSVPPVLPLPDELWAVLVALLEKDPRGRPTATAAAESLRRLAVGLGDVPALEAQAPPGEFSSARGPVTVVRGLTPDPAVDDPAFDNRAGDDQEDEPAPALPDLGAPGSVTVVRPMSRPSTPAPLRVSTARLRRRSAPRGGATDACRQGWRDRSPSWRWSRS